MGNDKPIVYIALFFVGFITVGLIARRYADKRKTAASAVTNK